MFPFSKNNGIIATLALSMYGIVIFRRNIVKYRPSTELKTGAASLQKRSGSTQLTELLYQKTDRIVNGYIGILHTFCVLHKFVLYILYNIAY